MIATGFLYKNIAIIARITRYPTALPFVEENDSVLLRSLLAEKVQFPRRASCSTVFLIE